MKKLDPRLSFWLDEPRGHDPFLRLDGLLPHDKGTQDDSHRIMLCTTLTNRELDDREVKVTSRAGDIVAGVASRAAVRALAADPAVFAIESAALLKHDDPAPPSPQPAGAATPCPFASGPAPQAALAGEGVIVGVIDTAFAFHHCAFRSLAGKSRILYFWDQCLFPQDGEAAPGCFDYGVEYSKDDIDAHLRREPGAPAIVRHRKHVDGDAHGTRVASIVGGSPVLDLQTTGHPTVTGVAPGADLIFVALREVGFSSGAADVLDAMVYVFRKAAELRKAAVINLSMGDGLGPHDGTDLLEMAMDHLLHEKGRAIVKSAGNAGEGMQHASGIVTGERVVALTMPEHQANESYIDIWYDGESRLDLQIELPDGLLAVEVPSSTSGPVRCRLPKLEVSVLSQLAHPRNGLNRIGIQIKPLDGSPIPDGVWTLTLRSNGERPSSFHLWVSAGGDEDSAPVVQSTAQATECTITSPGNGRRVFVVGAHRTECAGNGGQECALPKSSRGPTRDGRPKPDLCAWGENVPVADARSESSVGFTLERGTSIAAPQLAGVIARLFQEHPHLTPDELREKVRQHVVGGHNPDGACGVGLLQVQR